MKSALEKLEIRLEQLRKEDMERTLAVYPEAGGILRDVGSRTVNLSSNDYLNLSHHATVIQCAREALDGYGAGAGSSRLVSGTLPIHEELEAALATHKGYATAVVFGSGFLTNLGVVSALAGREDTIYADRLAHASLLDGIAVSRARFHRFRHNDPTHLDELLGKASGAGLRLVVTESVFSMDGDLAPLRELAEVCRRHDALLLIDEAHASGVFGPHGAGRVQELELIEDVDLCMGTLSKGLGCYGGYVACSDLLRRWLVNRARSFIYTTALPPAVIGAGKGALRVLQEEPNRGQVLLRRSARFRNRLQEAGLDTLASDSQILPVLIGDNARAVRISRTLRDRGIVAVAIRPPTVPIGTARLRLSVTSAHTDEDLEWAAEVIIKTIREDGSP